jgi:hypothetical protein
MPLPRRWRSFSDLAIPEHPDVSVLVLVLVLVRAQR